MSNFILANTQYYIQNPDPSNPVHVENYRMAEEMAKHMKPAEPFNPETK